MHIIATNKAKDFFERIVNKNNVINATLKLKYVAGTLTSFPNRIRWSDEQVVNPTRWTFANYIDINDGGEGIMAVASFKISDDLNLDGVKFNPAGATTDQVLTYSTSKENHEKISIPSQNYESHEIHEN